MSRFSNAAPTRLRRVGASGWVLGALVAIASWNVPVGPPGTGLDESWQAALYMSAERGLRFGSQIVFTYGPLGFLKIPSLWYQGLAIVAFIYSAALELLLAVSLMWVLRRALPSAAAVLVAFFVLVLTPGRESAVALIVLWCLVLLAGPAPPLARRAVLLGGPLLGAAETLALPRSGLVILLAGGIAVTADALAPRARRWEDDQPSPLATAGPGRRARHPWVVPAGYLAAAVLAVLAMWVLAGQPLGDLPGYVRNQAQIISGYSEAMGTSSAQNLYAPEIIGLALILAGAAALAVPPGRGRIAAAAVGAVASFSLYKEAVVRQDSGHQQILFATGAVILLAAAGVRGRRGAVPVIVLALAFALATSRPPGSSSSLSPFTHASDAVHDVRLLASPATRQFDSEILMALRYQLDAQTLALLRGHTVHVDPWEAAVAWLERLRWDPLPVFQGYSAYTARLDGLNAAALSSPGGPQRILRENTLLVDAQHESPGLDGRAPAWDPPGAALAMLCNYAPLRTTARWQVLGRTAARCGVPALVATLTAAPGRAVTIPAPRAGGLVVARLSGAGVGGLERLRALLYRARLRFVTVNGRQSFRLVPGTAGDGLLLDAAPGADFPAPFALSPGARTIAVSGAGPVTVRVYWMAVRPLPR